MELKAQLRKENKQAENEIPAVIYGPNSKNQNLSLDYKEFSKVYQAAGESTLVDLAIDEKNSIKVLIKEAQRNPVSDKFIHVDFYQLDMNKKLTVDVELIFEGIEGVEKITDGEVIKNLSSIQVNCLPKDLIKEITIDISGQLKEIGNSLNAKDVQLPEGLELITDPENSIVSVQEIKEEIFEEPKEEEAVEGEEGEEEGEKEEGEEGDEDKEEKKEEKSKEKEGNKKDEKNKK